MRKRCEARPKNDELAMLQRARAKELTAERKRLIVADQHILEGYARLRRQKRLIAVLGGGHIRIEQMERLISITSLMLSEWKRHRVLIRQRIAYLETSAGGKLKTPAVP